MKKQSFLHSRQALTLIELLIFSAIFVIISIAFITILVSIIKVQVRQEAVAEVNGQSQFLLQAVQYYVERSSLVDMTPNLTTSTLKLRMPDNAVDPTYIYLSGGIVYLKETDGGTPQPLSSDKVTISELSFVKLARSGGHDSVNTNFVVSYNTTNVTHRFNQGLNAVVARVGAATFDSNILASSSATYNLGLSAGEWKSINGTLYFSGSNVGIGVISPGAKFQVNGGDVYVDTNTYGLMLRDSSNVCWRVGVSTNGSLTTASTTCP